MASFFDLFKKSRKATLVNGVLTVTLNDKEKTVLVFHDADENLYNTVMDKSKSDFDVLNLYTKILQEQKENKPETALSKIIAVKEEKKQVEVAKQEEIKKEIAIVEEIKQKYPQLLATGDFTEHDGSVYLNAVPDLSIPNLLLKRFISLVQGINNNSANDLDEYCALKNFWMWCSLNPNPESRENLFRFIQNNRLKINKYGMFASYRRVVSRGIVNEEAEVHADQPKELPNPHKQLSEFISKGFTKIKGQKKSPKNFFIGEYSGEDDCNPEDQYKIFKVGGNSENYDEVGNLYELYQSLSSDTAVVTIKKELKLIPVQHYTDAHTHSMDIRIGKEAFIDPKDCDWNNHNACSRGLHIASKDGHGCGDTLLIVLVNPMKVVSVPYDDGSKARCWAYFPVSVAEGFGSLDKIDTLELGDEYYENSVKELNQMIQKNTPTELKKHRLVNDLSPEALSTLSKQVSNIRETLKNRVVKG